MKKIIDYEGFRTNYGYHTGNAVYVLNGKYYVSQESGTRQATKNEIKKYNSLNKKGE